MKAIRKSDGKVIEVREWRGASDVVYSDPELIDALCSLLGGVW